MNIVLKTQGSRKLYDIYDGDRLVQSNCTLPTNITEDDTDEDVIDAIEASLQPNLEARKASAIAQLAASRYAKELEGVVITASESGYDEDLPVDTDPIARSNAQGRYLGSLAAPEAPVLFKFKDGEFRLLTGQQFRNAFLAGMVKVQALFDAEEALKAQIEACETIQELEALDLTF